MSKRITQERVKKYGIATGAVLVPTAVLLIWFMASLGSIEITGYSGDVICAGTELDPCIAYINFTANEDVFIYPGNWSQTSFYTDPQPKDVKMYRSWGNGWRYINLSQGCTGTWCGKSPTDTRDTAVFSYAFREGKNYSLKFEVLKENPKENVKWGYDSIDPIFYSIDKFKEYNEEIKEITFNDKYINEIAKIRLLTPLNNKVKRGYNIIAKYQINSYADLNILLSNIELYDKNNNMYNINRNIDIKYEKEIIEEVDDFKKVCNKIWNETEQNYSITCKYILVGKHNETKIVWEEFNKTNFYEYENVTIGLFTNVEKGDIIEWVPTFDINNNKLPIYEWAVWTEDLNAALVAYYKLNETSGVVLDSLGNYNGTNVGADRGVEGKINNSFYFNNSDSDFINFTNNDFFIPLNNFSISAWFKAESGNGAIIANSEQNGSPTYYVVGFNINLNNSGSLHFQSNDGSGYNNLISPSGYADNSWHHFVVSVNSSKYGILYLDNVSVDSGQISIHYTPNNRFYIGCRDDVITTRLVFFNGTIDEIGLWSVNLDITDVNNLWNNGNGISYDPNPILDLNYPIFSNYSENPSNNTEYVNGTKYEFNVTILSTNTTAGIEFNGTNYTIYNISNNYNFSIVDLATGTYGYYYFSYGNGSETNYNTSEFRYYTISPNIAPIITFISPENNSFSNDINLNITYNVTDTSLDSCWYSNDSMASNISLSGCSNITNIIWSEGNHNIILYANDTQNNVSKEYLTFTIDITNPLINFTSNTPENDTTVSTDASTGVFIEVNITETNVANVTYILYNSTELINTTVYNSEIENITYYLDTEDTYYYNVTVKDLVNQVNYTETRQFTLNLLYDFNITVSSNTTFRFTPNNNTQKGVSPTNQSNDIGVLTIHNNISQDISIYAKLNSIDSNYTFYLGNTSNYTLAIPLTASYQLIYQNLSNTSTDYLWSWIDYNYATHKWSPLVRIKAIYLGVMILLW